MIALAYSSAPAPQAEDFRYGLVTRNGSLVGETKQSIDDFIYPFFIDWITIQQVHAEPLPIISDGHIECCNSDGEVEWKTIKAQALEGSYSSKVTIRCDGHSVRISGNVGRLNRRDNLFGYALPKVIAMCNEICDRFGLPHFTMGETFLLQGADCVGYTGATISRLDLTCNYATGSEENARDLLRWFASQQDDRMKTGVWGEGTTVDFGRGSKRLYHKLYNKYAQLAAMKESHISPEVLAWVRENGIVRHEMTLKSRWLRDGGLRFLGVVNMEDLNKVYAEKAALISRADKAEDGFGELPNHLRLTVRDYLAGEPFRGSRAKFYKHRKELLSYGIDIATPSKVTAFVPRVKVIQCTPVSAPDWYWAQSVAA